MTAACVLMAYGTPRTPEEIEPYYTDIRRGRPPTPEQLADLTRRYEAIGGISPLAPLTEAPARRAAGRARRAGAGRVTSSSSGSSTPTPKVEAGVAALAAAGVERIVGLVLAPHYSAMSIGEYLGRARPTADAAGMPFAGIESWATEPAYVEFLAAEVRRRLADDARRHEGRVHRPLAAPADPRRRRPVPRRAAGDGRPPSPAPSASAQWTQWSVGWQSAGRTPEPWIGPDILAVVDELAAADDVDGLLVCPCGFVADHLEVLYDLDIEARQRAEGPGWRSPGRRR